jgi:hypothetical protein
MLRTHACKKWGKGTGFSQQFTVSLRSAICHLNLHQAWEMPNIKLWTVDCELLTARLETYLSQPQAGKCLKYRQSVQRLLDYCLLTSTLWPIKTTNTYMKTCLVAIAFLIAFIPGESYSQLSKLKNIVNKGSGGGGVTENEAGQGIKEALTNGVTNAVLNLNKTDGFFGSEFYKMLLPPDAQKIETSLRKAGMGSQVDKAILSINRGAEEAVAFAKPIFIDAIKEMTITDALNILRGSKDAATQYFKQKTTEKLVAAFTPSVKTSLDNVGATKHYGDIVTTYNSFPTTFKKVNPDLPSFVVGKAVDALFDQVAKEEANIRANPLARTSDILKKVFGSK